MPQAIPAIVVALKATAFTIGSYAVTYGTIAKVALLAASAAYSRNQSKKAQRAFASLRDQGTTVTFSDPMAVAAWIYGECRVGGVVVFAHTTGANNKDLHQVMVLCPHALTEIDDIYFGDEALGMPWNSGSPSNVPDVSSPYYGAVRINRKVLGGSADSELVSESGGAWTTDDKLTDISSLYVKTLWNVDKFPQGLSFNISCNVKGRECYDPRDSSTGYTNNPALILRDYLVNFCGYSTAEIDDDDVIAAANICDESVTIADSTTQARYTFNGRILTDTKPVDGRQMIARSMAGWCSKVGAKWRMKAGAHQSSSLSLTAADFIGPIEWVNQDPISDACNAVRARWLSPEKNWQEVTTPLVRKIVTAPNITAGARCTIVSVGTTSFTSIGAASNTVGVTFTATGAGTGTGTVDPYLGEDNGVEHIRDIDLFGVTNEATALRLARIQLEESRHGLTFVCRTTLKAMTVQAGDYVDATLSPYGWTNKLFRVASHREIHETGEDGVFISIALVLREVSSAIYSRTAADETTADPAPNTDMQNPRDVVTPVLGTLESDDDQLTIDSRGTVISRIKVPWTCADPYVLSGGTFELEYKESADADWLPAPIAPPKGSDEVAWIGPVVDGEDYDVRIRAVNGLGVHSDWDTESNHTVIGKSASPDPVTSLAAEAIPGGAILTWIKPADLDLGEYWIYENDTNSIPADPSFKTPAPTESFTRVGLDSGETRYWWVKAVDTSGNASTAAGSVSATTLNIESPTYMFHGAYLSTDVYYQNANVRSVVKHGGSYYRTDNAAKDGLATWGTPGTDWEVITWIPALAATDLLLAKDVVILKKLTMGDGSTADAGVIAAAGNTSHTSGSGYYINPRNSSYSNLTTARFGNTSGNYIAFDGTNVDAVMKTFTLKPSASGVQFVVDTDSTYVGPNPPARMTFGTMLASNNGTFTTLDFATGGGGVTWSGTTSFSIGTSLITTYGINASNGNGSFADLATADDLTVGDRLYIGTTDCEFYRDSANVIKTPDSLIIGDDLTVTDSMLVLGTGRIAGNFDVTTSGYGVRFEVLPASSLVRTRGASDFEVLDGSAVTKFQVLGASGNTSIAGTLGVTGNTTATTATFTGAVAFSSTVGITGVLTVGASGQIDIGADCNLFRAASNRLQTNDALDVDGQLRTSGHLVVDNGGEKFKVSSANGNIFIQGVQVLSTRATGFANQTATPAYTDLGSSPTNAQIASWIAAIDGMLKAHGIMST